MLAPPRHSSTPTCTLSCAWTAPTSAASMEAAMKKERRMEKLRKKHCDAGGGYRVPPGRLLYATTASVAPNGNRPAFTGLFSFLSVNKLAQIAAEALNALAGVFEIGRLGCVGNPERRAEPERRTLHDRDTLGLQQLGDKALVVLDQIARGRGLADGADAGGIDVERAVRPRTVDALRLIEHADHEIAPF